VHTQLTINKMSLMINNSLSVVKPSSSFVNALKGRKNTVYVAWPRQPPPPPPPPAPKGYNPPKGTMYREFSLDKSIQCTTMFKVIGKDGSAFKAITYESGCEYIWWDSKKNVIELYAHSESSLNDAYYRLQDRIAFLEKRENIQFGTFSDRVLYGLPEVL